MRALFIGFVLCFQLAGTVFADFPPASGELALELNMAAETMTLFANQATGVFALTITSPQQTLNALGVGLGAVFFVRTESTTGVYREGSTFPVDLNGNFNMSPIYNFKCGGGRGFVINIQYPGKRFYGGREHCPGIRRTFLDLTRRCWQF